jgi:hypothetical protein
MPEALNNVFQETGFATFLPSYAPMLAPFSTGDYYKETYHSPGYVVREWGKYFDVLECLETRHQDIILLRAR